MISDNAKTIMVSAREVKIMHAPKVLQYLSEKVTWEFIAEQAYWCGGLGVSS